VSIDFRLTLAGELSVDEVADCAALSTEERPAPVAGYPGLLSADLYNPYGFALSIVAGRDGYYDAKDDDGAEWEWEPGTYVDVDFHMGKDDIAGKGIPNMLAVTARVLACRPEDAALVFNGDLLLFTRTSGVLRKHNRRRWWDFYGFADEILPS
jgi:hypothetical protein